MHTSTKNVLESNAALAKNIASHKHTTGEIPCR